MDRLKFSGPIRLGMFATAAMISWEDSARSSA